MKSSERNSNAAVTNWERMGSWFVFLFFLLAICVIRSSYFTQLVSPHYGYHSWEISEWLINYEGGFVRRGIVGQILYAIEQVHVFDVRVAIRLIYAISSLIILLILYRVFKSEGWSPLLLPTGLCLGYTLFSLWGRKDFLMLALAFAIFLCYRAIITRPPGKRYGSWLLLYVLAAIQLLAHEASFFFTYPILMLYSYRLYRRSNMSRPRNAARTLMCFLPVLAVMAAVCLFKGDKSVAQAIWASWGEVFAAYPDASGSTLMGSGVQALGWNAVSTFKYHFHSAYLGCGSPSPLQVILALFVILSAYFLLTRIDCASMGKSRPKHLNRTLLSDVALVQFIALLPMFTVLSCDWGRTLPYWMLSSMFFYHVFKHEAVTFPPFLTKASRAIHGLIDGNRLLRSPATYLLLVLLTPVPNYYAPLDHTNTIQQAFFAEALDFINHITTLLA